MWRTITRLRVIPGVILAALGIAFLMTAFTAYGACLTSNCVVPVTGQHIDMETLIIGGVMGLMFFGGGVTLLLSGRRTSIRATSALSTAFFILGLASLPFFGVGCIFLLIGAAIRWGGERDRALVAIFLFVLVVVALATTSAVAYNGMTLYQLWNEGAVAQSVGTFSGTFLWVILLVLFSGFISMGGVVYFMEPRGSSRARIEQRGTQQFSCVVCGDPAQTFLRGSALCGKSSCRHRLLEGMRRTQERLSRCHMCGGSGRAIVEVRDPPSGMNYFKYAYGFKMIQHSVVCDACHGTGVA